MTNLFSKTKIYLLSVFVSTFVFLVACQPDANKLTETCFDEVQNQGELWIDCGGPNCPACLPTCTDCVLNGEETRPDCGGPSCPVCATCEDGIQNGHWINTSPNFPNDTIWTLVMEKGIDCGYPCPNYCEPSCANSIIDGVETGIDCDEDPLTPCPPCNLAFSCNNGIMDGNEVGIDCDTLPFTPCPDCGGTCNDGIMNQDETGVDCGSIGCLVPCGEFTEPIECPTGTCFDGIMNNGETGIDCGGPCLTEDFMPTLCPPPTQFDGIQNGNEEGVDCGESTTYINAEGDPVEIPCPTCDDNIKNGNETGIDCGGNCSPCATCCDGFLNGDELDVDCIWANAPNTYNHPCLPCKNYVRANIALLGGGANIQFEATGIEVITTVSVVLGVQEINIKATNVDGYKLEIRYTGFYPNFGGIQTPHNLNSSVTELSSIKFSLPDPVISWTTAAIPTVAQGTLVYYPLLSDLVDAKYFRGGGNGPCFNYSPILPPPFNTIPATIGQKATVSDLDWGVFYIE